MQEARRARRQLGIQISPEEASQLFKINYEQEDQVIILYIDFIVACCIITMHKVNSVSYALPNLNGSLDAFDRPERTIVGDLSLLVHISKRTEQFARSDAW